MKAAFTLVELMIVVAIVAILSAIAIPNFADMQLRAKRSEAPLSVKAIHDAALLFEVSANVTAGSPASPGRSGCMSRSQVW